MRTFEEAVEDVEGIKNVFKLKFPYVREVQSSVFVFSEDFRLYKGYNNREEFIRDVERYDWRSLL